MVILLMLAGVVLVATSGWLFVRAISVPRLRVASHLRTIDSYGFGVHEGEVGTGEPVGVLTGTLASRAEGFGEMMRARIPRLAHLTRPQLNAAGIYQVSPDAVHGFRGLAALGLPALLLAFAVAGGGLSLIVLGLAIASAGLAWQGPAVLIRRRGRLRLDKIDQALPQLVDLIVATVEAGLGFGAALASVAGRFSGPLGDELRLTLQQQSLGVSSEGALQGLAERCDTPFIRAFVRTVIRAEAYGTSIGPVMRHLASDIRQRRRDAAREKIQKAPVKMLVPLLIFILLPLMLVIFFPAAWGLFHVLNNS